MFASLLLTSLLLPAGPEPLRIVAYEPGESRLVFVDGESGEYPDEVEVTGTVAGVEWSTDGRRLLVHTNVVKNGAFHSKTGVVNLEGEITYVEGGLPPSVRTQDEADARRWGFCEDGSLGIRSADGKPDRIVHKGVPLSEEGDFFVCGALAPIGRFLVYSNTGGPEKTAVVDLATGRDVFKLTTLGQEMAWSRDGILTDRSKTFFDAALLKRVERPSFPKELGGPLPRFILRRGELIIIDWSQHTTRFSRVRPGKAPETFGIGDGLRFVADTTAGLVVTSISELYLIDFDAHDDRKPGKGRYRHLAHLPRTGMVVTIFDPGLPALRDQFARSRAANARGMKHHRKGRYKKAAASFAKAVEAWPADPVPTFNLACAQARQGDAKAAVATLERYRVLNPGWKAKARKDKDFDGIRTTKVFQRLMQ